MSRHLPASTTNVRVAIAVTTRDRPEMLKACLASFRAMCVPDHLSVLFVIVENTETPMVEATFDEFSRDLPASQSALLLHEPKLGIPFARNRALDEAILRQSDWLIFVDDDETVAPDWLTCLVEGAQTKGYDLAVGRVEPLPPEGTLSAHEAAIFSHYAINARGLLKTGNAWVGKGRATRFDLPTNNWIARIAALQEAGLRFDEAMRHTGGTDTDLSRRAQEAGLQLGWLPQAVVYEIMPRHRLTFTYIFRRSCNQTLAKYHIRFRKQQRGSVLRLLGTVLVKIISGGVRILISFAFGIDRGTRLRARGIRALGVAVGYLQGLFGRESNFYRTTQGH